MTTDAILNLNRMAKNAISEQDPNQTIEMICKETAIQLSLTNVSVWQYLSDFGIIKCLKSYDRISNSFAAGTVLSEIDFPEYFSKLREEKFIEGNRFILQDCDVDSNSYFTQLHHNCSTLYIPFYSKKELAGFICLEEPDPNKIWLESEKMHGQAVSEIVMISFIQHDLLNALETIRIQHSEILDHNRMLETKVKERTQEIEQKNKLLKNVMNLNANQMYGTVCTMSGLIDLILAEEHKSESDRLIQLMKTTVDALELMIRKVNEDIRTEESIGKLDSTTSYLPE